MCPSISLAFLNLLKCINIISLHYLQAVYVEECLYLTEIYVF